MKNIRLNYSQDGTWVDEQERCYAFSALQVPGVQLFDNVKKVYVVTTWPVPCRVVVTSSLNKVKELEEAVSKEKHNKSLLGTFVESPERFVDKNNGTYVSPILLPDVAQETVVGVGDDIRPLDLVICVIWDHRGAVGARCDFSVHLDVSRGGPWAKIEKEAPKKKKRGRE